MWLATYGDMVTNMLVFFVLLLSMSEIKKDDRFMEFMQAVREAFGYVGGMEQLPLETVLDVKNSNVTQFLIVPVRPHDFSPSPDPGVRAKHPKVSAPRPPERYAQGGKCHFAELSAELPPDADARLTEYAGKLRGYRTQIEVRGHCNPRPVDGTEFADHYELCFQRARVVAPVLLRAGVAPERIVIVAAGTGEPKTTGSRSSRSTGGWTSSARRRQTEAYPADPHFS
ncbi:MAG: OmpA/MotB family protein [Planctomycetota bacterium]